MADNNNELEYAVRRDIDKAYLWDDNLDGEYLSWEDGEDNGTWLATEAEARAFAIMAKLVTEAEDGTIILLDGYSIVSRPVVHDDEIEPDPDDDDPNW
ncbi:hypothetical protein KIH75_05220 [Bifidobacterium sp. 64T4]|uniref:hypothetical protein n=1 Tax=Bifidobacterium pongonis TaxID=2834432 RepID=UPI001C5A55F4|nr:hypothetical protein [Bifidobacterium pongonis]MBW3094746.1 hypothetical protein [Bifidobacterium pongonis]